MPRMRVAALTAATLTLANCSPPPEVREPLTAPLTRAGIDRAMTFCRIGSNKSVFVAGSRTEAEAAKVAHERALGCRDLATEMLAISAPIPCARAMQAMADGLEFNATHPAKYDGPPSREEVQLDRDGAAWAESCETALDIWLPKAAPAS